MQYVIFTDSNLFEVLIKKEENQNKLSDERNISSTKENENEISTENGSNLLNTNLALNKYKPAPDKKTKIMRRLN